jgi:hypothetical protein
VSILLETLLTDFGLDQFPDRGMGIHWHGAIPAALLTTVTALRKEVRGLVGVEVWVFQIDGHGKLGLVLVELGQIEHLIGLLWVIEVLNQHFPVLLKVSLRVMSPGIVTLHETELGDDFPQDFIGRGSLGEPEEARDRILILEFWTLGTVRVTVAVA